MEKVGGGGGEIAAFQRVGCRGGSEVKKTDKRPEIRLLFISTRPQNTDGRRGRMHFNARSRELPIAHSCSTFYRLTFSPEDPEM